MKLNKEIIFVFLAVLFIWWILLGKKKEKFDTHGVEFVPVGEERYGIRGDHLRRSDISRLYIRPDRHINISHSGGMVWESNNPPGEESMMQCNERPCPCNVSEISNEYDGMDTCWTCGNPEQTPMAIPDIHSHA